MFSPPSEPEEALESLRQLRESPSLVMLGEGPGTYAQCCGRWDSGATGILVHDAHIAALCLEHGVSLLYTMDRDFSRFAGLKIVRPF